MKKVDDDEWRSRLSRISREKELEIEGMNIDSH